MRKRGSMIVVLGVLAVVAASPVAAGGAKIDRLGGFETVLAVAMPDNFPVASLMRAHCLGLVRVERPDGSATEIQDCLLTDEPVMIPANQGTPPTRAFVLEGPSCTWYSDFWGQTAGADVPAASFRQTVTPSGHVHVQSEYPAEPLACE